MNFKYRFMKSEFVLSAEEHAKVLGSLREGNTQMVLRGGRLGFNLNAPHQFEETDEPTVAQRESAALAGKSRPKAWEEAYRPPTPEQAELRRGMLAEAARRLGKIPRG